MFLLTNTNITQDVLDLIANAVMVGGGIWTVWHGIQFAMALKDSNGPDMKSAILGLVGGGVIIALGAYFKTIA